MNSHIQGELFPNDAEEAKGKNVDSLAYSRKRRKEVLDLFGGEIPQSIMRAERRPREKDADLASGTYGETGYKGDALEITSHFGLSSHGVRNGALSTFPQNIGRMVLRLYAQSGDTIVDPFAGHNSRMELCWQEGCDYIGCDISNEFMQFNERRAAELLKQATDPHITLYRTDSRWMREVKSEIGDFTLTSPPYWNIEYYGPELEQLGLAYSYSEFLRNLKQVCESNFRTLKPGAFCVWFVNDFRMNGKFFPYHSDVLRLLHQSGFLYWDILIVDLVPSAIGAAFASNILKYKILPKKHEYGLVMRKPQNARLFPKGEQDGNVEQEVPPVARPEQNSANLTQGQLLDLQDSVYPEVR